VKDAWVLDHSGRARLQRLLGGDAVLLVHHGVHEVLQLAVDFVVRVGLHRSTRALHALATGLAATVGAYADW
jgi:hypothetical protein